MFPTYCMFYDRASGMEDCVNSAVVERSCGIKFYFSVLLGYLAIVCECAIAVEFMESTWFSKKTKNDRRRRVWSLTPTRVVTVQWLRLWFTPFALILEFLYFVIPNKYFLESRKVSDLSSAGLNLSWNCAFWVGRRPGVFSWACARAVASLYFAGDSAKPASN